MNAEPGRVAGWMIGLAVRFLPRGRARERYRQEFLADLHHLGPRRQWRYAVGVAAQVLPLRVALERSATSAWESLVGPRQRKPWPCRLNLRHRWVVQYSEDGTSRYRTCSKCHKDFYFRNAVFPGLG